MKVWENHVMTSHALWECMIYCSSRGASLSGKSKSKAVKSLSEIVQSLQKLHSHWSIWLEGPYCCNVFNFTKFPSYTYFLTFLVSMIYFSLKKRLKLTYTSPTTRYTKINDIKITKINQCFLNKNNGCIFSKLIEKLLAMK